MIEPDFKSKAESFSLSQNRVKCEFSPYLKLGHIDPQITASAKHKQSITGLLLQIIGGLEDPGRSGDYKS